MRRAAQDLRAGNVGPAARRGDEPAVKAAAGHSRPTKALRPSLAPYRPATAPATSCRRAGRLA